MSQQTTSNPYSSTSSLDAADALAGMGLDFLPIMRRWERLRLIYNGLLAIFVFIISFFAIPRNTMEVGYWISVVVGGCIANLCYLVAPAIEAYATYFRLWCRPFTILLFLSGLGFTALLAVVFIATIAE